MSYKSIFAFDLSAMRRWLNSAVIRRGRSARVRCGGRHAVRTVVAFVATGMLLVMVCTGHARADTSAEAMAAWQAAQAADARHDYATELKLLQPLAEQGDALAQFNLGLMYAYGEGVPRDDAEAVRWYRKAAERGDAQAQGHLGYRYENGEGVPQDYTEAVKWYRKAAEQGYALRQVALGIMYDKGRGVPKDYVQAYMWFNLAAAGGDKTAAEARDDLEHSMTVQQIAEAQRRTAAWRSTRSGEQQAAPGQSDDPWAAFHPEPAPGAAKSAPEAASGQLGTGFFIGEGVLLTNAHVVKGCSEVSIGPPERRVTARVVARDNDNDLALLRTAVRPPAVAALRLSVRQGEAVAAYGFPLPGLLASGGNLTTGNITALSGIGDDSRFLQISAPVQPGNSGGPLLDGGGNVVGIVEGKLNAIKIATIIGTEGFVAFPGRVNCGNCLGRSSGE